MNDYWDEYPANHGFVGRTKELEVLKDAVLERSANVIVHGMSGTGKTALAYMFREVAKRELDCEVQLFNCASHQFDFATFRTDMTQPVKPHKAVIFDEINRLSEGELHQLRSLIEKYPSMSFILMGQRLPSDISGFRSVQLDGMSHRELDQLLKIRNQLAHAGLDGNDLEIILDFSSGNPAIATTLFYALHTKKFSSAQELLAQLQSFSVPGILGPDGRPLNQNDRDYNRIVTDVKNTNTEILERLKQDPEFAWQLPPRKFEEIVADILDHQGYDIELTPASGDGGFDIYAAKKEGLGRFLYLVECKRYKPPNKVGVEVVRSLHGVVQKSQATAGAVVSTSFFTKGAKEFQQDLSHRMHLHDFLVLQSWISKFPMG